MLVRVAALALLVTGCSGVRDAAVGRTAPLSPLRWRIPRPMTTRSCLAALLLASGCVAPGGYWNDRVLDASDVVDLKYGGGVGLGVHVQATKYLQTGIGFARWGQSREWFGRLAVDSDSVFVHFILYGLVGMPFLDSSVARSSLDAWGVNCTAFSGDGAWTGSDEWFRHASGLPILDRFRVGGVLYLPGVHGGVFLNVGELLDFTGGLFTADLMNDDGIEKGPPSEPLDSQGLREVAPLAP